MKKKVGMPSGTCPLPSEQYLETINEHNNSNTTTNLPELEHGNNPVTVWIINELTVGNIQ